MTYELNHPEIRAAVVRLCKRFPGGYWQECDRNHAYQQTFVTALIGASYLAALIPEAYSALSLPLSAGAAILEEIHCASCNTAVCHAQMYTISTLLRHDSDAQKSKYLPQAAQGNLRLQAFGVTEPTNGTDTSTLRCTARKEGQAYIVNYQEIWTSRAENSDSLLLLARTTPLDQVEKRTESLSVFLVDMREGSESALNIQPHS